MTQTLLPFLAACTLVALSPGPSTVLIIRNSLRGRRLGMLTVLGNETGVFLWGLFAAFGLTALLAASEAAYDVMRYAGAVVLVAFGIQALRSARKGRKDGEDGKDGKDGKGGHDGKGGKGAASGLEEDAGAEAGGGVTGRRAYRTGLLVNLANPKAGVFAMSFLPQFVPSGAPHLPAMVGLAAFWAVYEVGFYACYVWGVGRLRKVLSRAGVRRRLEQVSGGVLLALGVRLALDG
ncbi:LysE family translocator [Streptomyces boncukensis]|uniref:LysE family translocator n=1 Tax=Streptomyces boncukensis TaxID=2711219 RepID=A0A6G4WTD5_9ACTN|nr:LysE family translocator [Streptomyces boncukensis]NGO68263.1 LysE family translocator [Streptomyces boncukensis]